MTADTWVQVVQELGLGVALGAFVAWQLKKVLADAREERDRYREERAEFLKYLQDEGTANRAALSALEKTLYELRGSLIYKRVEEEDK